jgi:hypothetical protein
VTVAEIATLGKDVLLGLAAATTAIVAALGLRKWRQELEGKAHFEAARNLIRSTYRLRDAIRSCRNPFYSGQEFPEGYKGGLGGCVGSEEEVRAWAYIYKNRWAPVWAALQEFDATTLEAEALWGSGVRAKTDALRKCLAELNAAIDADLRNKAADGQDFQSDREYGKDIRSTVAASADEEGNKFNQKLRQAIDGIEQELRPHLRRS